MSDPKRHHTLSAMLTRRFADERGLLFWYSKKHAKKGIMRSSLNNVFVRTHEYSFINQDGSKDTSLEKRYAIVEGMANKIIEQIIMSARSRSKPLLTDIEKKVWDNFVVGIWRRSPDFHESLDIFSDFDEHIDGLLDEYEKSVQPLTDEERVHFNQTQTRVRIRHNARVDALARGESETAKTLGVRGLGIAVITNPRKSFIIGSFPVVKFTKPQATNLGHPDVEAWLPVAPDVAVTPAGPAGTEHVVPLSNQDHIRSLNEAIFRQSDVIAGPSRALISSLVKSR